MRKIAHYFIFSLLLFFTSFLFSSGSYADPPNRVSRLSFMSGQVSYSPAGENVWAFARLNRPLVTGDRIWVSVHARAELQLGTAALRMEDKTSLRIINLNNQLAQFDLAQGTLVLNVRQINPGQTYEVDTP